MIRPIPRFWFDVFGNRLLALIIGELVCKGFFLSWRVGDLKRPKPACRPIAIATIRIAGAFMYSWVMRQRFDEHVRVGVVGRAEFDFGNP